jgi:hypothetical protein
MPSYVRRLGWTAESWPSFLFEVHLSSVWWQTRDARNPARKTPRLGAYRLGFITRTVLASWEDLFGLKKTSGCFLAIMVRHSIITTMIKRRPPGDSAHTVTSRSSEYYQTDCAWSRGGPTGFQATCTSESAIHSSRTSIGFLSHP